MSEVLQTRLREFTRSVLERRGALVEWPENADEGWAMLPPPLAGTLQSNELLRLTHTPDGGGLCANLGTDFLDRIAPLVEAEPRLGLFQIPELYLKKSAMDEPVARAFTWQNAKVKVKSALGARVEYHAWSFLASLQSEDSWEEIVALTLNSDSGAEVGVPAALQLDGLQPFTPTLPVRDTLPLATARVAAQVERRAAEFITRLEGRLQRDRRRLRDYYRALLKESKPSRSHGAESETELAAKHRAVELELNRKTAEVEERYVLRATLTPLVLVRVELPVLAVQCEVFRKQARKLHTLYWNPVLTALEPLRCSACGTSSFSIAFTNDEVEPLCAACGKE